MVDHRPEHGGHAVHPGAAFIGQGIEAVERIEGFARKHHGGTSRHGCEIAEHHAEAMIKRHRDGEAVVGSQIHGIGAITPVVDDVAMGEGRPLGGAGGARRELDVDGIIGIEAGGNGIEAGAVAAAALVHHLVEREHAGKGLIADLDNGGEVRQAFCLEAARRCRGEFRRQVGQHGDIVRRLELAGGDEGLGLHLVEGVFELVAAVGRVDVDQDEADARRGELGDQPRRLVGRPDADAVALVEPQ